MNTKYYECLGTDPRPNAEILEAISSCDNCCLVFGSILEKDPVGKSGAPTRDGITLVADIMDSSRSVGFPGQEQPRELTALSRSSSVESLMVTLTSFSSFGTPFDAVERLHSFYLADDQLWSLCQEAIEKIPMEEFEDNFRRCLQKFSAHLKAESTSPIMTRAAREVRLSSRRSANLIRSALELAAGEMEHTGEEMVITSDSVAGSNLQPGPQDSNEYAGNDTDEDIEDDVAGDSYHEGPSVQEDLENIEAVLGSSKAFQLLRENLRLFVHPDPIRRALFRVWPIALERSSPFEIKYEVRRSRHKVTGLYCIKYLCILNTL
jgi:hypothetical protein